MNLTETLKLAIAAIWGHKLRSFLTLLGMIIGVMTFMIVLSILQGFNVYVDEKIAGIGSNAFTIQRFSFEDFKDTDSIAAAQRRNKELTFDELEFIRERAQTIDKIGAKAFPNTREVKRGSVTLEDIRVDGAEPVIGEIENVEIGEGRYFTNAENENQMRVAFIGSDIAAKLFPRGGAVGGEIKIRGIPYKVIGVQKEKGTVFGMPQDAFVTLPLLTYGANFGGLTRSRQLSFKATSVSESLFDDAVEEARTLMRVKRKLEFGKDDTFRIITPDAISQLRDSIFGPIFIVIILFREFL